MKKYLLLFGLFVVLGISAQTKKVLLEQFTTERCPNCPKGAERIKEVLKKNNYEDKVIWIAHHTGFGMDKYTLRESKDFLRFYGRSGYFAPAMMLDRTVFYESFAENIPVNSVFSNLEHIKKLISVALSVPTSVSLKIEQDNSNVNQTNDVKIKVSGTYKNETPKEELYVSVYLVENGIQSKTQKGSDSHIYTHNHVIRKMLNGSQGTKIEWNGNTFSVELEGKLGKYWEKKNMKVVAFVSKNYKNKLDNSQILNAEEVKLEVPTGLNSFYAQSLNIFVENNKIFVNGDYTSIKVYTVEGKEVVNNNLPKGVYLVKVANGSDLAVKKVVVF